MDAQQFVALHGLQKAKDALAFVPENKHHYASVMVKENGFFVEMDEPELRHEDNGAVYTSTFKLCREWQPKFTKIAELKAYLAAQEN